MTSSAMQSAGLCAHARPSRLIATLAALFVLSLAACGDETEKPPPVVPVASISVVAPATTLERSLTMQLTADVRDANGGTLTNRAVVWSTSDAAIAEVNARTGQVRGKGRGKVTITATSEGKSGQTQLDIFVLYKSIQLGDVFSCDVGSGGVASCWGFNGFGVLGNGTQSGSTSVPTDVLGGLAFTQVSTSTLHACGLTAAGEAYCWGSNSTGQGGTGDMQGPSLTPRKVVGGQIFTSISAGDTHTCGLTREHLAYCWGDNGYGQSGVHPIVSSFDTPMAVAGNLTFKSISAGVRVTCGVTTSNQAYCWGSDANGELGNGGPISYQTTDISYVPVGVAGGLSFSSVSVGQFYACGITTTGIGYCWGRNDVGRLGNGGTNDTSEPSVIVSPLTFTQLDTGFTHACAVATNGDAYCWGANNYGEVGVSEPADLSRVPMLVSGGGTYAEVAAGWNAGSAHSCGISADRKTVRCWGRGDYGQLGNGGTSQTRTDVPVTVVGQKP